jgi:2-oxoglutarate dehydrogenase E2 component (dihydrolipoamide succinyltransferase)
MPQLGETVTEGTILKWAKQVGDTIAEDEVLLEISTDKVDTEVPSPVGGTILEILVQEGDTVEVGVDLVVIGEAGEETGGAAPEGSVAAASTSAAAAEPEAEPAAEPEAEAEPKPQPEAEAETEAETEPAVEPEAEPAAEPEAEPEAMSQAVAEDLHPASETPEGADMGFEAGRAAAPQAELTDDQVDAFFAEPSAAEKEPQLLSPVVRRLIREHQLDVSQIKGSGQGGRVTRKDVEAFVESGPPAAKPAEPAPASAEEPSEPTPAPAPAAKTEPAPAPAPAAKAEPTAAARPTPVAPGAGSEEIELSRLRVRVAENNIKAKQTAAHVWTSVEVDFERLERVRQAHKDEFKANEGFSLTYLPFISRATIDALKAYPVVNSSFNLEKKTATFYKKVDLGIAIDLNQDGLVVARVRNADGLRLVGIAREIASLAERARAGDLGIDDLSGSTFTITNPGPFGSFMSAPIINVPNVGILSTDTITKRPTVVTTPDGQDMIAIRHIGYLGLSWDHRAFDGSTAVMFLSRIKENIETWDWSQEMA